MPSSDAWSLVLQFAPAYLADSKDKDKCGDDTRQSCDMVGLFLAQKPHSPEGYRGHSEIRFFLYQQALASAQKFGQRLLDMRRHTVARREVMDHLRSDADVLLALQRPRQGEWSPHALMYPEIFFAAPAFGERPEDEVEVALNEFVYARWHVARWG